MADRKITELSAMSAGGQATGDLLTIVDVSEAAAADKNKKITMANLFKGIPGDVGIGTSSPNSILEVKTPSGTDCQVRINEAGTNNPFIIEQTATESRVQVKASQPLVLGAQDSAGSSQPIVFKTRNSERARIDHTGRLLIGTTSALDTSAEAVVHVVDTLGARLVLGRNDTSVVEGNGLGAIRFAGNDTTSNTFTTLGEIVCQADGTHAAGDNPTSLTFKTTPDNSSSVTERMRIDSSGRLLVGSTESSYSDANLQVANTSGSTLFVYNSDVSASGQARLALGPSNKVTGSQIKCIATEDFSVSANRTADLAFETRKDGSLSERMRIDSSGRLLIGTSSAREGFYQTTNQKWQHQIEGTSYLASGQAQITNSNDALGAYLNFAKSRGTSIGSNTVVQSGDTLGVIDFHGNDGTDFVHAARISAAVDSTPGLNDMPGRIEFSTTADGGTTPTERMRITRSGDIRLAMGNFDNSAVDGNSTNDGVVIDKGGGVKVQVARSGGTPVAVNRIGNDGNLVNLRQGGLQEGSISVNGSTVSYNGGHLSRWSQLAGGAERTEILRGSVMSNLDEMCEWGEEGNEQLNRMQVSSVEGDVNVSGVFQAWDDDDDTYTNDFYCAMTGDFVIRIAQGTTVARGDLLMSAGDGTAKPQDDDIVRSKTIAKVTSTTVSTTYADGSYCVPCVLMAC